MVVGGLHGGAAALRWGEAEPGEGTIVAGTEVRDECGSGESGHWWTLLRCGVDHGRGWAW